MTAVAEATAPAATAPASEPAAITVEGLTASIRIAGRWFDAVRDVSFEVRRQETLALVGESGCGKSLTALSIMGLLPAGVGRISAGRIVVDGVDMTAADEAGKQAMRGERIGMIFQEPMTSLNPVLPVGFQIAEALVEHRGMGRRQAQARALELMELVRIPSAAQRLDAYPHQFSGGMRQRVMIAIALACSPKVLIADEPTTALDVTIQAQVLALLADLQAREGLAVLLITHNLGVVASVADRVMVMYGGDVVESAPVKAFFRAPDASLQRGAACRDAAGRPALGSAGADPGPGADPAGHAVGLPLPVALPAADREMRRAPAAEPAARRAGAPGALLGEGAMTATAPSTGEPLLVVRDLAKTFKAKRGWPVPKTVAVRALDGVSFSVARGRGARHRRRVGLRQVDGRARLPAPDRARCRHRPFRRRRRGVRRLRGAAVLAAAASDRVPGPRLGARSAPAHRRRARRADPGPRHREGARGARAASHASSTRSACRRRRRGATRTSSRAVSASASASPARSRSVPT